MSRNLFVPFLAAAFVLAPGILPAVLAPSTTMNLSDSALAQKSTPTTDSLNLNSSRSNNYKTQNNKTNQPGTGGPAGIAVSDPGIPNEPTKPTKPKNK